MNRKQADEWDRHLADLNEENASLKAEVVAWKAEYTKINEVRNKQDEEISTLKRIYNQLIGGCMTPQEIRDKYGRAQLGIDGNAAFALLGGDLQEGEVEFVDIPDNAVDGQLLATKRALHNLRKRLNMPDLSYYFGPSHPYGG